MKRIITIKPEDEPQVRVEKQAEAIKGADAGDDIDLIDEKTGRGWRYWRTADGKVHAEEIKKPE